MHKVSHATIVNIQYRLYGLTLFAEKSQALKVITTHFYRFYSIAIGSKGIAGSKSKEWHLFLVVFNILLLIGGHIGSGMPNLYTFYKTVTLWGALSEIGVWSLFSGRD